MNKEKVLCPACHGDGVIGWMECWQCVTSKRDSEGSTSDNKDKSSTKNGK